MIGYLIALIVSFFLFLAAVFGPHEEPPQPDFIVDDGEVTWIYPLEDSSD